MNLGTTKVPPVLLSYVPSCWTNCWDKLQFCQTHRTVSLFWTILSFAVVWSSLVGLCLGDRNRTRWRSLGNSASLYPSKRFSIISFTNILWAIFVPIFLRQKITKPNCNLYEKGACKILMKLTPGWVDFTNMFIYRFYVRRSEKHKKTFNSSVFFLTFGICKRKNF